MTDRQTDGRTRMREVLGDAYFEAREKTASAFNAPIRQLSEESAYSFVWGRPGLDRRTRSLLCIAMMAALGKATELRMHLRGALNNGCTVEEIQETLLQTGIYCGIPTALESTKIAEELLKQEGLI
jgi:4-carboxymuconolactone decarboxylase